MTSIKRMIVVYSASEIGGNHAQKSAYKQTHYRAGDPNGRE